VDRVPVSPPTVTEVPFKRDALADNVAVITLSPQGYGLLCPADPYKNRGCERDPTGKVVDGDTNPDRLETSTTVTTFVSKSPCVV